jgi:hypothetical protein
MMTSQGNLQVIEPGPRFDHLEIMEAADLCDEEMEPAILLVSMLGNEHEAYWRRRQAKFLTSSSMMKFVCMLSEFGALQVLA